MPAALVLLAGIAAESVVLVRRLGRVFERMEPVAGIMSLSVLQNRENPGEGRASGVPGNPAAHRKLCPLRMLPASSPSGSEFALSGLSLGVTPDRYITQRP